MRRNFGWFAAAFALMAMLIGVLLVPTMELSHFAGRHRFDPSWTFGYSLPPDVLIRYIEPGYFGDYLSGWVDRRAYNEYGLYVSIPALFLALVAFGWAIRSSQRVVLFLVLMLAWSHVMALGGNFSARRLASVDFTEFPEPVLVPEGFPLPGNPDATQQNREETLLDLSVHELYVRLVPLASSFRVPARFLVVAMFLWASLAGVGADLLRRVLVQYALPTPVTPAASVALMAIVFSSLYLPSRGEKFRFPKPYRAMAEAAREDALLRTGPSMDDRIFRLTVLSSPLVVSERELQSEAELEEQFSRDALRMGREWSDEFNGLYLRWMMLFENDNVVAQVPSIEGYGEGLSPTVRTEDFLRAFNRHLRQKHPDEQFLALLGVGHIQVYDLPVDEQAFPLDGTQSRHPRYLAAVPAHRGAMFWAAQAEGIDFASLDSPFLAGKHDAPMREYGSTLYEYGKAEKWNGDWPRIHTDVLNPNRIVAESDGPPPGDAILSMSAYPGWEIEGRPLEWLGAVHARIPKSAFHGNAVTMEYKPLSYRAGLFASAFGLAIWFALLAVTMPAIPLPGRRKP
ncbi:hypothetical protein HZA57_07215 [Candidatus Poribacteria bacterium]|nr:hypothetical protein [Candidatus Poribacteria bacterium]